MSAGFSKSSKGSFKRKLSWTLTKMGVHEIITPDPTHIELPCPSPGPHLRNPGSTTEIDLIYEDIYCFD